MGFFARCATTAIRFVVVVLIVVQYSIGRGSKRATAALACSMLCLHAGCCSRLMCSRSSLNGWMVRARNATRRKFLPFRSFFRHPRTGYAGSQVPANERAFGKIQTTPTSATATAAIQYCYSTTFGSSHLQLSVVCCLLSFFGWYPTSYYLQSEAGRASSMSSSNFLVDDLGLATASSGSYNDRSSMEELIRGHKVVAYPTSNNTGGSGAHQQQTRGRMSVRDVVTSTGTSGNIGQRLASQGVATNHQKQRPRSLSAGRSRVRTAVST